MGFNYADRQVVFEYLKAQWAWVVSFAAVFCVRLKADPPTAIDDPTLSGLGPNVRRSCTRQARGDSDAGALAGQALDHWDDCTSADGSDAPAENGTRDAHVVGELPIHWSSNSETLSSDNVMWTTVKDKLLVFLRLNSSHIYTKSID